MGSALQDLLDRHVDSGTVPGAVAVLGGRDPESAAVGMATDAIVRIQSMTKIISAVAALRLVEAGTLDLDESVVKWLPELADRRVLRSPTAELDDTEPVRRDITPRDLLTNMSGYGVVMAESPLQRAMLDNGTETGPEPPTAGADAFLQWLAELPLAFQPGEGWRYHHSFAVLGILIARVAGRPLGEHLEDDLFAPLGMGDTAFWVPDDKLSRLPAAYRHGPDGLVETEPAGGGFYAGPPPFDVSHSELVSTARDFHRFLRAIVDGSLISASHRDLLTSDQVPSAAKTADSFFPGFWDGTGWGFGVAVVTEGPHRGRFGWSGGLGTDFFVDPDGTIGILLAQVEMGAEMWPLIQEFQEARQDESHAASRPGGSGARLR